MPHTLPKTGVFVNTIGRRIPTLSAWKRGRRTSGQRGRQVRRPGRAGPGKGRAAWQDTEGKAEGKPVLRAASLPDQPPGRHAEAIGQEAAKLPGGEGELTEDG